MPGRDGTGPLGQGALTGGGFGFCGTKTGVGRGFGMGRRIGGGFGCRMGNVSSVGANNVSVLKAQAEAVESHLNALKAQIQSLEGGQQG